MTTWLSAEQIQKVKDKTVKEAILAEMQTRYSRNLWSSSFAWEMYSTMEVNFQQWLNEIDFIYNNTDGDETENTFTNRFEVEYLGTNYINWENPQKKEDVTLEYKPYEISCVIWETEENKNLVIVTRINDRRDYCFQIDQNNCRLNEVSTEKCCNLRSQVGLDISDCNL
jgi:hypothetical protein